MREIYSEIINDRVFWIYFMIVLFFIIIGIIIVSVSDTMYKPTIGTLWSLTMLSLLIICYYSLIIWSPRDSTGILCVIDRETNCFDPKNRTSLYINILFVILIIMSILWLAEINNEDSGVLRTMSGIVIILGGLLFCNFITTSGLAYKLPFWICIFYIIVWFGLTLYVTLK